MVVTFLALQHKFEVSSIYIPPLCFTLDKSCFFRILHNMVVVVVELPQAPEDDPQKR